MYRVGLLLIKYRLQMVLEVPAVWKKLHIPSVIHSMCAEAKALKTF